MSETSVLLVLPITNGLHIRCGPHGPNSISISLPRAVASSPAGQAMAGPVLINYVDTHAQMQQLSGRSYMVLLRVESRLNILHSCLDLLAASFFAMANLLP